MGGWFIAGYGSHADPVQGLLLRHIATGVRLWLSVRSSRLLWRLQCHSRSWLACHVYRWCPARAARLLYPPQRSRIACLGAAAARTEGTRHWFWTERLGGCKTR